MLIDVYYNTNEIDKYHCLTTTMCMSGNKEKSDGNIVIYISCTDRYSNLERSVEYVKS